jgi:hypothetical protein
MVGIQDDSGFWTIIGGIIDQILWREAKHLSDIRNYCDHPKEREPRKDEVEYLISEAGRIIARII